MKRVWPMLLGITLGGLMMTHAQTEAQVGFHAALAAPARSPAVPDSMDIYGWLIAEAENYRSFTTGQWMAMIWDHASNWDEEDVRALIAFLRVLSPVRRAIPATRPPAADDCEVYTFWVDASSAPGCR